MMTRALQVLVVVVLGLVALLIAAAFILLGPSASADCAYSGGGWICAGSQPPSEPGELPTLEPSMPSVVIETPEPTVAPEPAVAETVEEGRQDSARDSAPPACVP